jgi:hypothetical protein
VRAISLQGLSQETWPAHATRLRWCLDTFHWDVGGKYWDFLPWQPAGALLAGQQMISCLVSSSLRFCFVMWWLSIRWYATLHICIHWVWLARTEACNDIGWLS